MASCWCVNDRTAFPTDHIGYMKLTKEDDLVKAITWCDENLPEGSFFCDWTPFDHPQLGPVEIGGAF